MESNIEGSGGDAYTYPDQGAPERRKVKSAESSENRALAKQDFRVGVEKAFNKTYSDSYPDVQLYKKNSGEGVSSKSRRRGKRRGRA